MNKKSSLILSFLALTLCSFKNEERIACVPLVSDFTNIESVCRWDHFQRHFAIPTLMLNLDFDKFGLKNGEPECDTNAIDTLVNYWELLKNAQEKSSHFNDEKFNGLNFKFPQLYFSNLKISPIIVEDKNVEERGQSICIGKEANKKRGEQRWGEIGIKVNQKAPSVSGCLDFNNGDTRIKGKLNIDKKGSISGSVGFEGKLF